MGISGPITTVHDKHLCYDLAAVVRIGLVTRRWLSDRSRSAAVVLGNHPISVGLIHPWPTPGERKNGELAPAPVLAIVSTAI
jgi:hypothetical protein